MFGHNDDDQSQPPASTDVNEPVSSAPTMPSITPVTPPADPAPITPIQSWSPPGAPQDEPVSAPAPPPVPPAPHQEMTINPPTPHDDATNTPHDLIDLKQQALSQLTPIVGHLDQTPEEKFRTLMMMIQATDDQSMLKEAYDTAQKITDEKTKAQALLDVVNEINYFTQHKN